MQNEGGKSPERPEERPAANGDATKSAPVIPDRILSKVPPQAREELREDISEFVASMSWGPAPHPLAHKVTEEHVGQMLKLQEKGMELEAADRNNGRWFLLGVAALIVVLIGLLALTNKDDALDEVLKIGGAFIGGGAGGYGLAIVRKRG